MNFNLAKEFKLFSKIVKQQRLNSSAIAFWFGLVAKANDDFFENEEFIMTMEDFGIRCGLTNRATINRLKNKFKQLEIIDFKNRGDGNHTVFKLIKQENRAKRRTDYVLNIKNTPNTNISVPNQSVAKRCRAKTNGESVSIESSTGSLEDEKLCVCSEKNTQENAQENAQKRYIDDTRMIHERYATQQGHSVGKPCVRPLKHKTINNKHIVSTNVLTCASDENAQEKTTVLKWFEKFWEVYPKKKDRKRALTYWKKIKSLDEKLVNRIISSVQKHQQTKQWAEGFIPHPSTFLHGERWEDEIDDLSVGVNRDGKASYDIEGYQSFCRNTLMKGDKNSERNSQNYFRDNQYHKDPTKPCTDYPE